MDNDFNGSSLILIILFLAIFGWGGNGMMGRGGDYGNFATAASQQDILFTQKFDALGQKVNSIGDGICSSTFALNNSIKDGNAAVTNTIVAEGRGIQNAINEAYAGATAQIQGLKDQLAQDKIAALQAEVSELKQVNLMCGVPKINPYGYGVYPYQNNGCTCNNI